MKGRFFLDVVVGQGSAILKLLSGEDQSLLVRRDAFFVLDLGLDVFNGVGWFNVQGDGLSCEGLDENLHDDESFFITLEHTFFTIVILT